MLARRSRALTFAALSLAAVSLMAVACEKVPLLAPTGSTITLISGATALPLNGSTTIIAEVLESAGTPPHSGTTITFTTTLGTVQPSTATTDASGRVVVNFAAGTSNGTASINAISGGATTSTAGTIKIALGTASVGTVAVNAAQANLSSFGGTTAIFATVYDVNGNALPSVPVVFTTSAGSLSVGTATTDANGLATTSLTTFQNATVTAKVGATGGSSTTPS
ncbi:MAG TPA: Ig-like domain-containing protein, partial [Vicinamibacterales bacterium]|nr:Ig-like domain-containing protein [Vicinamibacterales bacterium]